MLHRLQRQELAPADIVVRQTDVVEAVIGQVPAGMAGRAVALCVEELETALGGFADRLLVASDPAVERSGGGNDGALEGGDRLGHVRQRDAFARKGLLEGYAVPIDLPQFGDKV